MNKLTENEFNKTVKIIQKYIPKQYRQFGNYNDLILTVDAIDNDKCQICLNVYGKYCYQPIYCKHMLCASCLIKFLSH
jgi:hypothetical protein